MYMEMMNRYPTAKYLKCCHINYSCNDVGRPIQPLKTIPADDRRCVPALDRITILNSAGHACGADVFAGCAGKNKRAGALLGTSANEAVCPADAPKHGAVWWFSSGEKNRSFEQYHEKSSQIFNSHSLYSLTCIGS